MTYLLLVCFANSISKDSRLSYTIEYFVRILLENFSQSSTLENRQERNMVRMVRESDENRER